MSIYTMPGRRPNPYAGAINSTSTMLYQMAMQKMEHRQMLERQRERREEMAGAADLRWKRDKMLLEDRQAHRLCLIVLTGKFRIILQRY